MILLNYVPFNGMEIEIQKTKKILNMPMICILLELTQGACFLVIGWKENGASWTLVRFINKVL